MLQKGLDMQGDCLSELNSCLFELNSCVAINEGSICTCVKSLRMASGVITNMAS